MVEWVKNLEDRDERNKQALAVIGVMGNLNPHLRDINNFRHKLWDHIQVISNFDIDIDSPYPVLPPESFQEKPKRIPYPTNPIRIRHYGRNTQAMVEAIMQKEDGELKTLEIQALANHMKKAYLLWNKDTVSDEQIFRDIAILSSGAISIDPNTMKLSNGYHHNHNNNGRSQQKNSKNNGKSNGSNGKNNNGRRR
jgi:hypothetical protein